LAEAKTKWVGLTRAYEIEREIKRGNEAIQRGEFFLPPWEEELEAEQDQPLPDLPPAPPALLPRDQFLISIFANAIKMLKATLTKPAAKFVAAADSSHYANDLKMIANFVNQVTPPEPRGPASGSIVRS
jgi:hypothetical protein